MLLLVIKRFAIFAILFGIAAGYSNYYAIDNRPVARIRRPRPGRPEVNIRPPRPSRGRPEVNIRPPPPSPGRPEVNIRPPPQRRNNPPPFPGQKYSHGQMGYLPEQRPQSPYWSQKKNVILQGFSSSRNDA